MPAVSTTGRGSSRSIAFWLGVAAVVALHLILINYFMPLRAVFGGVLIQGGDFDTHIGQAFRVLEGLRGWGHGWVYDVKLLAGQPEGVIFDTDNKGWELWTYAWSQLGVSEATAFNTYVLCAMLCCPFVVFAAARLFGSSLGGSALAAAMASSLWFFDSFCHWQWWVGMVSYAFASYFALLPLALFYRFIESRNWRYAAFAALANAVAHLIHPYSFFILVAPMLALYVRGARVAPKSTHIATAGIALVTIAVNLYWLAPALAHVHYILNSAFYCDTGLDHLLSDFFDILRDPDDSGVIGTRAGFRFLYFALAAAGFAWLYRRGDRRLLAFGWLLSALFALGYLGSHIPGALQIQPYRHVLPLSFGATLPAAVFCETLVHDHMWTKLQWSARASLAVASVFLLQHLGIEALYFLPNLIPEADAVIHGAPSPISKYGFLSEPDMSHVNYRLPPEPWIEGNLDEVATWVEKNLPAGARVLAETTTLGERLAWKTQVEVMGGFLERNLEHAHANFFRYYGSRAVSENELAEYLRTFNIGWVITQAKRDDFEHASALEPLPQVGNWYVYKTRLSVSPFLIGSGTLQASTNTIQVAGSSPEQLLLAYHWHESLRCVPQCRIERQRTKYDGVGLIRIPAPHPANFTIFNSYQ